MTITRILVPTDFGADADAALHYAVELSQQFAASVHLLHVVENPLAVGMGASAAYSAEMTGLYINLVRDADERLRRSIPCIAGARFGLEHDVRIGPAASTIAQFARDNLVDLIVMGTSGRTGVSHLLMGSVAERVVRTAPCPVLTMRAERVPKSKQKKHAVRIPA